MLSSFVDLQGIAIEVAFDIFIYVKNLICQDLRRKVLGQIVLT